jgi:predicted nucleic acid-binding protein
LAIELRAEVLPMDERRGRRVAGSAGLAITGLPGVVATAKRAGPVDLAKPVLELIQVPDSGLAPACTQRFCPRSVNCG